jgi:hypothetical protein
MFQPNFAIASTRFRVAIVLDNKFIFRHFLCLFIATSAVTISLIDA